ncbi:hypothetical protein G6F57_023116 [Rhizopus arrhizus]|nr:hypothetical protein G6F57_023116 [Rhizopus arrhizus]
MPFPPQHGTAQFGDVRELALLVVIDLAEGFAGIDHVVHQQHTPGQRAARNGDELGDIHVALLRAGGFAVAARGQDTQRHIENAGHYVTDAHTAARQTKNLRL